MNKERIRELALLSGFELKKQPDDTMDLHPYVYEFAARLMLESIQTRLQLEQRPERAHNDDIAVDVFALAMKTKMALCRVLGRGGWDDPSRCSIERLQHMLAACMTKGDPVDVGNLAMMLHHRRGSTRPPQAERVEPRLVSYNRNMTTCTLAMGDEKHYYRKECNNLKWGDEHD